MPEHAASTARNARQDGRNGRMPQLNASLSPLVKEIVYGPRGRGVHAGRLGEIVERGAGDGLGRAEMQEQRALARRADAGDFVERAFRELLLALAPDACRWRSDAPRRAGAGRSRAPDRAARSLNGSRPSTKNVSRPALRSGPLAIATIGTPSTPSSARTSRAASNWPRPPSIRTRSGQAGMSAALARRSAGRRSRPPSSAARSGASAPRASCRNRRRA